MSIAEFNALTHDSTAALRMTEAEYDCWHEEGVRGEWVDGEVVLMSPASNRHVQIQMLLSNVLHSFCTERGLGEVRGPEFSVRLPGQRRRRTPDLLFVQRSRVEILGENLCDGPPDAVFEIVSPDSVRRDWRDKYLEYEAAAIQEYWIIDPLSEQSEVYARSSEARYELRPAVQGRLESAVIEGFFLRPEWLFAQPLSTPFACLRELGVLPPT